MGLLLEQIIAGTVNYDQRAKLQRRQMLAFASNEPKLPVTASLMRPTFGQANRLASSAGEQPLTLADTLRPALTECLAGAAHMMGRPHEVLEWVFEVADQVAPVSGIQL